MDFKPVKIAAAMGKAFRDVRGGIPEEKLQEMTDKIVEELEGMFMEKTPSVEEVQDVVERRIMTEGFYDVAKHYILYRYDHAILREEKKKDTLEKIEKNDLFVVKRSGKRERFSLFKLKKTLSYAVEGYEDEVDSDVIATQCQLELYDGIKTRDIMRSLVMTARSLIELDPAYSHVAARLLRFMLYKDVIGPEVINFHNLSQGYREAFKRNLRFGVEIGRLDPRLLEFDLDELANSLVIERDELFKYLGAQTLYDRYLLQNPDTREVLETPQAFWMRVAMGLSILEKDINGRAKEFYGVLSTLRFVSSTPTLFHAGTLRPQ
ncbi:MAG: Ribonucleoside-diphosphate reductase [Parcubacteria group bacterium GW2011_GWA2_45_30]|nr:MAG: Ribonucleoside-diphosphate reductase [Parcubacteria group bacterium GW2011_GWA2_45_30]